MKDSAASLDQDKLQSHNNGDIKQFRDKVNCASRTTKTLHTKYGVRLMILLTALLYEIK